MAHGGREEGFRDILNFYIVNKKSHKGLLIALLVIALWFCSLSFFLNFEVNFSNPLIYIFILIQAHLYTGLFITAHDAMHGTVYSANRGLNNLIGQICTALYAAFPFKALNAKHHLHHSHVHSHDDPDYHHGNFFQWYFHFITQYITWWQIVFMAIIFNILKLWFDEVNLVLFWVIPSLISTLQLFYFGTYLPHKGEHDNKHQSRSQKRNHFLAFISCYFFGYHYEHHDSPGTPWWQLWILKDKANHI
ncbi:fatty acid desaturase [Pedobacter glucosidilyticus]|nr:fatty acid desaturase [Pedobacter glucosidilyticus]